MKHSFVVEAAEVRWEILKFIKYLWGVEFTVISDCILLLKIFESEGNVPHVVYRWQSELLK